VDAGRYLERIGYAGPVEPSLSLLRELHVAHLLAVPFENLDIHRGRPIALDIAALYDKIVARRRGGFCYELNGLFSELLRALGFRVTLLAAGVAREDGSFGPEFDHLALRVDLEEPWLADVGFGDSFREPLPLAGAKRPEFRLAPRGGRRVLYRLVDGAWLPQYRFTLQSRRLDEFTAMCHYHQTSPLSSFTRGTVCTLATPGGRITLRDRRMITTEQGARDERLLESDGEVRAVLRERFGMLE
jgi:N-hydroxyarylamine O-acetyltransferase